MVSRQVRRMVSRQVPGRARTRRAADESALAAQVAPARL